MRRLLQECKFAHGNAALLLDALAHAKPEDLDGEAIIKVCPIAYNGMNRSFMIFCTGIL